MNQDDTINLSAEAQNQIISEFFDEDFYLATNPDVLRAADQGLGALNHFLTFGWKEGRRPVPFFDLRRYSKIRPILAEMGINPFYHFIKAHLVGLGEDLGGFIEETVLNEAEVYREASKLFDSKFYLSMYPELKTAGVTDANAFDHYRTTGWRRKKDPSSGFGTLDYIRSNPDILISLEDPLTHSIVRVVDGGDVEPARTKHFSVYFTETEPHDLFDHLYFQSTHDGVEIGREREAFKRLGFSSNFGFNPLFDPDHFRGQLSGRIPQGNLLEAYQNRPELWKLSPHPMFDPEYYKEQVSENLDCSPLQHYLTLGWKEGLSPHPLFSPGHYEKSIGFELRVCPLVHYILRAPLSAEPHELFSDAKYRVSRDLEVSETPELLAYLLDSSSQEVSPHPLFDPDTYSRELNHCLSSFDPEDKKRLQPQENLLVHYLKVGWRLGLAPSGAFDPEYYTKQIDETFDRSPLEHFIAGGFRVASCTLIFDNEYYSSHAPDWDQNLEPGILHLLRQSHENRSPIHSLFDAEYYRSTYADIAKYALCPYEHFLFHGWREERRCNEFFSPVYVMASQPGRAFARESVVKEYFRLATTRSKRVVFTSHDASMTGAPKIILRLIQDFSKLGGVECITLLDRGGPLIGEFSRCSHAVVVSELKNRDWNAVVQQLMEILGNNPPLVAVSNSAESRHLAEALHKQSVPVISLIHEHADPYPATEIRRVFEMSETVVVPSDYVAATIKAKGILDGSHLAVRGQGLLADRFGKASRDQARARMRRELSIDREAFVVLGCGTPNLRKGVDYFIQAAREYFEQAADNPLQNAYFIWLGGVLDRYSTLSTLVDEVEASSFATRIRFIDARENVEDYFLGADAFLMTSRADPFPCVIHEAMAAQLPVICFKQGGGAHELIGADGFAVPLGGIHAMVSHLRELASNETLRRRLGRSAEAHIRANWQSHDYFRDISRIAATAAGQPSESFVEMEGPAPTGRKVYFLSPDWGISGVNSVAVEQIRGLRKLGFDARFLFTQGRNTHFEYKNGKLLLPEVPYEFVHGTGSTGPRAVWSELERWARKAEPCVIIPNYDYIASAVSPLLPDHIGLVGIAHSDHEEHYEHVYRLGRYWQKIICVSQCIKDVIDNMNPALAEKSVVIHNGIEIPVDAPKKRDYDISRPIQLVYAGRFVVEQKQIYRYLELARELRRRGVPFVLHMFGHGAEYDKVLAEVTSFSGAVKAHGRRDRSEVLAAMCASDFFLLLSDYEGLSVSMLEAMSVGCIPLVYRMESGIGEIIKHGKNGLVVQDRSIEGAADLIVSTSREPRLRNQLSSQAYSSMSKIGLTAEVMAKRYKSVLDDVFSEIERGEIVRPPSLNWRDKQHPVMPPFWMYRE